jgi:alkylated DNA repair dioxygenase AlkB
VENLQIQVMPGCTVEYIEGFYSQDEADELLRAFLAMDITPEVIRMYGRDIVTKRRSMQFGVDYDYNATAKHAEEWTPTMRSIRERIESLSGPLHGALVQLYPDGDAGIGWHRDKGMPEVIASISLGAEREFAFGVGPAARCAEVWRMRLAHGSVLLIPGKTNEALKHRLPPAKRVREPRVNVTFRRFPRIPILTREVTDEILHNWIRRHESGAIPWHTKRENHIAAIADVRLWPHRASMGSYTLANSPAKGIQHLLSKDGTQYHSLVELGNPFVQFQDWDLRYRQLLEVAGDLLMERLLKIERCCLLSSEKQPTDCHRMIIGEFLTRRGYEVTHLVSNTNPQRRSGV